MTIQRKITTDGWGCDAPGHLATLIGIDEALRRKAGRCEIRPVALIGFDALGGEVAQIEADTHSGRIGRVALADGLVFLHAETDQLPAGAPVEFLPFQEA
ncbi:molybdopterin molybdotransferase [Roseivivax lentus]|uniref:Molybdopterin molybdotransferase n=1 Tax=Roseivivax lentus TaxID=633194 RepID=A0A1N7NV19_9RHOB|nr:hypothetical protein [Roseivivax lentus]SIT02069.1 molybdopterin molybdotransferase [Roseivivax lentus]